MKWFRLILLVLAAIAVIAPTARGEEPQCNACRDAATIECPTCDGSGRGTTDCRACKGSKLVRCRRAPFVKHEKDFKCPNRICFDGKAQWNDGTEYRCKLCRGKGELRCGETLRRVGSKEQARRLYHDAEVALDRLMKQITYGALKKSKYWKDRIVGMGAEKAVAHVRKELGYTDALTRIRAALETLPKPEAE